MLLFSGANCMPLQSVRSEKSILGGHDYLEVEHVITKGQKIFSEIKSLLLQAVASKQTIKHILLKINLAYMVNMCTQILEYPKLVNKVRKCYLFNI